jgi:hypothetical protein
LRDGDDMILFVAKKSRKAKNHCSDYSFLSEKRKHKALKAAYTLRQPGDKPHERTVARAHSQST